MLPASSFEEFQNQCKKMSAVFFKRYSQSNILMQVSLPLLAPLLLGTGMMLRGIRSNASIIFPRICVMVVLLYVLWFFNSVVQNTVVYLRRQARPRASHVSSSVRYREKQPLAPSKACCKG